MEPVRQNRLLSEAPDHVRAAIASVSTECVAEQGAVLAEAGQPVERVCFIERGAVSLVGPASDRPGGEVALIGPDGMTGALEILIGGRHTCTAIAQADCAYAEVDVDTMASLISSEPALRDLVQSYSAGLIEQITRISVCHARHTLMQRLAGWIQALDGHLGGEPIFVTHRQIAELLCVRRATVTEMLHVLEGDGALRSRRGSMTIRNRTALAEAACDCRHG